MLNCFLQICVTNLSAECGDNGNDDFGL